MSFDRELLETIDRKAADFGLPTDLLFSLAGIEGGGKIDAYAEGDHGWAHGTFQANNSPKAHGGTREDWIGIAGTVRIMDIMAPRWVREFIKHGGASAWRANPAGFLKAWMPDAQGSDVPTDAQVAVGLQVGREAAAWLAAQRKADNMAALDQLVWPVMTRCDVHPSNYRVGREGYDPENVFWHTAAGTLAGGRSWAMNPAARASWHFLIGRQGEVDAYVDPRDTAIANGAEAGAISPFVTANPGVNINLVSIAIEHDDEARPGIALPTAIQWETSALVSALAVRDFILPAVHAGRVTGWAIDRAHFGSHSDVAPLSRPHCNGWGEVNMQRQINRVRDLIEGVPTSSLPIVPPSVRPEVVEARDLMTVQAVSLNEAAAAARLQAAAFDIQAENLVTVARRL